jgi:SAM-dependent methyltransferase
MDERLEETLLSVARFYDQRKVGDVGALGFRRSSDLALLAGCFQRLLQEDLILPHRSCFLDLGCADGRVNILFSYMVRTSVGVELNPWTLDEYAPLRAALEHDLQRARLIPPPKNIYLFAGDSTNPRVHRQIEIDTGLSFEDFDLFYTYLIMHQEFAAMIAERAAKGAHFLVYGLDRIMPRYEGLWLREDLSPMNGILGVYEKA